MLYPLRFEPIYKEKIWGGDKISKFLEKDDVPDFMCGESWEISSLPDNVSKICNGALKGIYLNEIISEYKKDVCCVL